VLRVPLSWDSSMPSSPPGVNSVGRRAVAQAREETIVFASGLANPCAIDMRHFASEA